MEKHRENPPPPAKRRFAHGDGLIPAAGAQITPKGPESRPKAHSQARGSGQAKQSYAGLRRNMVASDV